MSSTVIEIWRKRRDVQVAFFRQNDLRHADRVWWFSDDHINFDDGAGHSGSHADNVPQWLRLIAVRAGAHLAASLSRIGAALELSKAETGVRGVSQWTLWGEDAGRPPVAGNAVARLDLRIAGPVPPGAHPR